MRQFDFLHDVGPIQGNNANPPASPESNLWDGSSWSNVTLPPQHGWVKLTSVSCLSSTFCMAVGGTITGVGSHGLCRGMGWINVDEQSCRHALRHSSRSVLRVLCEYDCV